MIGRAGVNDFAQPGRGNPETTFQTKGLIIYLYTLILSIVCLYNLYLNTLHVVHGSPSGTFNQNGPYIIYIIIYHLFNFNYNMLIYTIEVHT